VLRYRIVDVFSERPFEGNGLCVVLDRCPDELIHLLSVLEAGVAADRLD
jgi:hypothetical protein